MADEKAAKAEEAPKSDAKSNKGIIGAIIGGIVLVVAAVVLCIVLNSGNKVVGKYDLYSYIQDGQENTTMVNLIKGFGMNMTVEFKGDKTGVLETTGGDDASSQKFTYDDKKIKLEADGETKETDYKLDGDYVTITVETETMKFKRQGK